MRPGLQQEETIHTEFKSIVKRETATTGPRSKPTRVIYPANLPFSLPVYKLPQLHLNVSPQQERHRWKLFFGVKRDINNPAFPNYDCAHTSIFAVDNKKTNLKRRETCASSGGFLCLQPGFECADAGFSRRSRPLLPLRDPLQQVKKEIKSREGSLLASVSV